LLRNPWLSAEISVPACLDNPFRFLIDWNEYKVILTQKARMVNAMRTHTTGEIAELLMFPEQLEVQAVFPSPTHVTVRLACTKKSACCPQCQTSSQRIHSTYGRTLADLPCAGRRVILALTVRKFVCGATTCPGRIFTERLPKLTQPYARMTNRLRAAHHDLDLAYQLSQAFVLMLTEHRAQNLDDWLRQARQSGIRELKSFAYGIRRDYAAVRAAFTSEWSQGQVEAQVNCLKLQKRLMFGRANFDLLRLRVLRRA
jgi:transposase